MVVSSLGYLFASYISDWITEKPATQTFQWVQINKQTKRTLRKAYSLQSKDKEKDSLARLNPFGIITALLQPNSTEKD